MQTWILALDIGECPAKNRGMSDKFFSQRKQLFGVYFFIRYHCLKTQNHSISMGLSCSAFSFYQDFNRQITYAVFYIQNRKTRLSKRYIPILCCFFALLGTASLLFCEQPVLIQCFLSLTPKNFKNREDFQVFKGVDERNISPN